MTRAVRILGYAAAFAVSGAVWWWLFSFLPEGGSSWRDRPPARFQGDNSAAVVFTSEGEIQRRCPMARPEYAVGCVAGGVMYLPNPCRWRDPYATLACHELGHISGWSALHER